MTPQKALEPGSYGFKRLQVGDVVRTGSVLVSNDLIERFSRMTGDTYAPHMDESAARAQGFKGRVAHGLLVLSIVDGLKFQADAKLDGLASLSWRWKFQHPVYADDTIRAELTIEKLRPIPSLKKGIATCRLDVFNQHDQRVQFGTNDLAFSL